MATAAEYLEALRRVRATGEAVPETSYYPALQQLLSHIGQSLAPKVYANPHPKNRGAGIPDLGLFTADQLSSAALDRTPWDRQVPARGVVEAKGPEASLDKIVESPQVHKYLKVYGQVVVTNLRAFVVVALRSDGSVEREGILELAGSAEEFWRLVDQPAAFDPDAADSLESYLREAISRRAPITSAEHLAWFLAGYARTALQRVERNGLGELASLRQELQRSLGVSYTGDRAEKFFRSTLIQTVFYGVFSVWVIWNRERELTDDDIFDWRLAGWELDVPVIAALFSRIAEPVGIKRLHLAELLDLAGQALNRVDRTKFFERFDVDHAIEYFYEPFLAAFDPDLRKELGVWYTPSEVVEYMTGRVDEALRQNFGLRDGLADAKVTVLDPCVGTGSFLLAVGAKIYSTLHDRNPNDALIPAEVKEAFMGRLFGFEILPAPFVVAHLQIGLMLRSLGVPLDGGRDGGERAAVYLTNSLTGWRREDDGPTGLFPALEKEREAAEGVKRRDEILVVIGNPPYNAFAGVSPSEEGGLVEPYKKGVTTKNTLDDLYVRFVRVAERRIAEQSGKGIICFITNSSFISRPSFRSMREHLLNSFDYIHVDNLNGDRDESGKKTPGGRPDPSIFSTKRNHAGIAEGVCITTMVRLADTTAQLANVTYRDFWGRSKRDDLLAVANGEPTQDMETATKVHVVTPTQDNLWSFRPVSTSSSYYTWPRISDIAEDAPTYGLHEARGGSLIDIDRERLENRMQTYLDPSISYDDLGPEHDSLKHPWYGFDPVWTRRTLIDTTQFSKLKVARFLFRPFDVRYAYVETRANLWVAPQRSLVRHASSSAYFVYVRRTAEAADDGAPILMSRHLGDQHALHKTAYLIPTFLQPESHDAAEALQPTLLDVEDGARANLSAQVRQYLDELGIADPDTDMESCQVVWLHALAVAYAPAYTDDNKGAIRQDYPRVPLPADANRLKESATLGKSLLSLLDPVDMNSWVIGNGVPTIASLRHAQSGAIDPRAGHLEVTEAWGYVDRRGSTMAGQGKLVRRERTRTELESLAELEGMLGIPAEKIIQLLGKHVVDIYLNGDAYWCNIPEHVWTFKLGGFQVLKKWLSYRQVDVLGRGLSVDEVREFSSSARRLAQVLLLGPMLDKNFSAVADSVWTWTDVHQTE